MTRNRTQSAVRTSKAQFSLRSLLVGLMWCSLLIAVCVEQQRASVRQREIIEQLKASGRLPLTQINGRAIQPRVPKPVAPTH